MITRGIKERLLFVAIAPAVLVALGLALYFIGLRFSDADAAVASRGNTLARQLADAAATPIRDRNVDEVLRLARATASQPDIAGVVIADAADQVLASAGPNPIADAVTLRADGWSGLADDGRTRMFHAQVRRAAAAAASAPAIAGGVTVAVSLAATAAHKSEVLVVTLLATLALLAAAAALAHRLGREIADPALELEQAIEKIRSGHYGERLPARPDGALARIESGVNDLAAVIEATQHKAERSLAEREEELVRQLDFAQAMLDAQANSGIGLAVIEYGRIVFANPAVERMSGYSLQELRAMSHFVEIAHPDDRELIMRNHLRRLAGEGFEDRYDFVLLRKDGGTRNVQLAQASITAGNRVQVLGILVDITARKQAEAQLAETHRQLLVRKEEAERSSLAKSRFLAAAGHDLRQPLHALMLFAAELETTAVTPGQKRLSGQIGAATGAMGELLDALLEVSRLDTAGITPQRQAHALGPLLAGVADAHRQSAAAKGLRLICVGTKAWGDSDPHLLRRLVSNLVANAVRYTQKGGIVIGVRREGENLRIEVRDTGVGIDAEQLPHIFQEFYQVGNLERDAGKGMGLGLAIVDRIARMLGHPLHVRSVIRRGSVFGVSVPRAAPAVVPQARGPQSIPFAARILVAGESQPELESLGNLLENWGYRVLRAGDERLLRSHMAAMPDLVVCDERFLDGLARALAGRPRPRPQVVLVGDPPSGPLSSGIRQTGAGSLGARTGTAAIEARAGNTLFFDGRLAKPVKPGRLRALLHHLLEEAAERAEGGTLT